MGRGFWWRGRDVLLLMAGLALFFVLPWVQGRVYGTFDLSHITIPLEDLYVRYQAKGELPLWTPEYHGGYPLMASGFQSFFYIPHVLLRAILPGVWAVNLSLLLHVWLAGLGMRALLKQQGFSRLPAWVGGLLFAGGGYLLGRITLTHLLFPAAWIPLVLCTFLAAWKQPLWWRYVLFAVTVAAQVFSGHIQVVIYTMIILLVAGLVMAAHNWQRGIWRPVVGFLLAGGLIFLLTAVHILPTRELLPQSRRDAALTGAEAFDVSLPASHLATLVYPYKFGHLDTYKGAKNEPELTVYFGLVGLVLGGVGIASRQMWRHALGQSALAWMVIGLALAGGQYSPVFMALHKLPTFFAQLANPGRAIVLFHVGWVVAACFGLAAVMRLRNIRWRSGVMPVLLLVLVGELLYYGLTLNPTVPWAAWQQPPLVLAGWQPNPEAPRVYSHATIVPIAYSEFSPTVGPVADARNRLRQQLVAQRDGLNRINVEFTWNTKPLQDVPLKMQVFAADGTLVREATTTALNIQDGEPIPFRFEPLGDSKDNMFSFGVTSPLVGSSAPRFMLKGNHGSDDFNPTGILEDCSRTPCAPVPSKEDTVADFTFHLRYTSDPLIADRELLLPQLGESFGVEMVRTHITLQLDRYLKYMYEIGERGDFLLSRLVGRRNFLDRLSVGTIIAAYDEHRGITGMPGLVLERVIPLTEDKSIHVYRNTQAYPKLQLAKKIVVQPDAAAVRQALIDGEISNETVAVEGAVLPDDLARDKSGTAQFIEYSPREVLVAVNSQSSQLVVLRDTFFTGWQAWVDGEETPIYYVDSLFRGVIVPPGEHEVRMAYHSPAFTRGAYMSGLGWLAVLVAGVCYRKFYG